MKKIPYKHICSICKKIFFSSYRGQNICSKECRRSIKRIKKYRKCIVCGWDATIEIHHEGGKEYDFCPNHHSLLTTGKQNIEEVLNGVVKSSQIPKGYICPIINKKEEELQFCPIINGSYKIKKEKLSKRSMEKSLVLFNSIKEANLEIFNYKDIMNLMDWKRSRSKKHVLKLLAADKIIYIKNSIGGKDKQAYFKLKYENPSKMPVSV